MNESVCVWRSVRFKLFVYGAPGAGHLMRVRPCFFPAAASRIWWNNIRGTPPALCTILCVLTLATVAAVSLLLALARKVAELVAFVALLLVAATRALVTAERRGSARPAVPRNMTGTFAFVAGGSGNHIPMSFYAVEWSSHGGRGVDTKSSWD